MCVCVRVRVRKGNRMSALIAAGACRSLERKDWWNSLRCGQGLGAHSSVYNKHQDRFSTPQPQSLLIFHLTLGQGGRSLECKILLLLSEGARGIEIASRAVLRQTGVLPIRTCSRDLVPERNLRQGNLWGWAWGWIERSQTHEPNLGIDACRNQWRSQLFFIQVGRDLQVDEETRECIPPDTPFLVC